MDRSDVIRAWGRIARGRPPSLSIEITTRCPLSCPGCYAYQPEHLSGIPLTSLSDRTGDALGPSVPGTLEHFLIERYLLFTERRGVPHRGQVHHAPYAVQRAEVLSVT